MKKLTGFRGILAFIVVLWVVLAASYGRRAMTATGPLCDTAGCSSSSSSSNGE